jgi:hypothetical protein
MIFFFSNLFFNFFFISSGSFPQIKQLSFQWKSVERILRSLFLGGEYANGTEAVLPLFLYVSTYLLFVNTYSERQKYGINSLKIKQNFFQKNLWTGQFSFIKIHVLVPNKIPSSHLFSSDDVIKNFLM